ncbi:hypothetical protein STEG23_027384 [Scotinomys teguina]
MEAEGLDTDRTCEVWKPGLKDSSKWLCWDFRKPGFSEDRSFLGRSQGSEPGDTKLLITFRHNQRQVPTPDLRATSVMLSR